MPETAYKIWEALKKEYNDKIVMRCSNCRSSLDEFNLTQNDHACNHVVKAVWMWTRSSTGRPEQWCRLRERPKNINDELCTVKRCPGEKSCKQAHSKIEQHIWVLMQQNNLFLQVFINTALIPDEKNDPLAVAPSRRQKSRVKKVNHPVNNRNSRPKLDSSHNKKFEKLLAIWKGRFLVVCEQCYNLEPKLVKEMEIGDGKVPKIFCEWCLGRKFLLLHETTYTNNNGITFYEYNKIRQSMTRQPKGLCRSVRDCPKGDGCTFPHSLLELEIWKMESESDSHYEHRQGISVVIAKYCNKKADKKRPTLNGMFHCDHCCLSFSIAHEYHKCMKRPHKHFEKISRRVTTWKYGPVPQGNFELCNSHCPGKDCKNAHSADELEEWKDRKKIALERSKFSLIKGSVWYELKVIPKDIREETRVKVEVKEDLKKSLDFNEKSTKWNLKITSCDKQFFLKKIGFREGCGYEIRLTDCEQYYSVIDISNIERKMHEFKVLFINPKIYGTYPGDLILEFESESTLYLIEFEIEIKGDTLEIPERLKQSDDWTKRRMIVSYDNTGYMPVSYDMRVKECVEKYPLKQPAETLNMRDLTPKNYVETMHNMLYVEEQARLEVLSRLNLKCSIQFGNILPNGNMLGTFKIPISVSTDEAHLFKQSCQMVLLGLDEGKHAFECKIVTCTMEEVTIDISSECREKIGVTPNSILEIQVQFQLDRSMFCLRHFALDNIRKNISFLCPSAGMLAWLKPGQSTHKKQCKELDNVQNIVYEFLHLEKQPEKWNEVKSFPPLVVAGPFGTGKTHTIRQILVNLLHSSTTATILVCTHTNSAADLYLKDSKIAEFGRDKVLRLCYHGRDLVSVNVGVVAFCLIENGKFRYPTLDELRKYKLIVTTFTTAMALFLENGISGRMFSHIFLDEASQAMEPDVIMPLLLADSKTTRILFAGDHRQTTEKMYSDNQCQVQTILERMYEAYDDSFKRCRVLLTNNYRCVSGLLNLISKLFYKEHALKNVAQTECIPGMGAVYFIQLQGQCIPTVHGDYMNEAEANQIVYEVEMLTQIRKLVDQKDIVVVSTFYSQVRYIRKVLRQKQLADVSVQTVQNIQGQEFKVVILSTVLRRLNCLGTYGENFGFLSDYRMLNVALTRAQSLVVVVGDAVTLCSIGKCEKYWKKFIQYCEEANTMLPKMLSVVAIKSAISLANQQLRAVAAEFTPGAKFEPAKNNIQQKPEEPSEAEGLDESFTTSSENDLTSQNDADDDDDDVDSWCSEGSLDDVILDDMIKEKTGIDLSKVTIGVGKKGDEYVQYESDESDLEVDPNEVYPVPSRRKQRRTAIYPKYTIEQLEQMLRSDSKTYKRCRIKVINWYSAEAIPIAVEEDENQPPPSEDGNGIDIDEYNPDYNSDHNSEEDGGGSDIEYDMNFDEPELQMHVERRVSPVIYIETRVNLGRTFDQDEALVEIIGERPDPNKPYIQKRIGKVLGILKARHVNPRNKRYLCRPDEFNTQFMHPYDRKLPLFAILAPMNGKKSDSDVPIYKYVTDHKRKVTKGLTLRKYEKVDETRVYIVRYLRWSECCSYPLGFVEGSFQFADFVKYLQLEYRVRDNFSDSVLKEAKAIDRSIPDDLPCIDVFTIDPEGSMDLDDAISFQRCTEHNECYEIGVHITDVAATVVEGSEIDKDAHKRFATFYGLESGPVHMLPSDLSTNKCSILPDQVRQAISTFFHSSVPPYSRDFTPVKPVRSYIKSSRKLTYHEAEMLYETVCDGKRLDPQDERIGRIIYDLWNIMWEWRLARLGGEAFYKNSDTYQHVVECRSHLLIEEAMISTNCNTAKYLTQEGFEIPMRVQDMPSEDQWTEWEKLHVNLIPNSCYLKSITKYLKKRQRANEGASDDEAEDDNNSQEEDGMLWEEAQSRKHKRNRIKRDANQVLGSIEPTDFIYIFENFWKDMVEAKRRGDLERFTFIAACDDLHPSQIASVEGYRSTQKKASFSSHNPFHFSLRLEQYAWSSSPMRRYPDILIQRCIHRCLEDQSASEETKAAIRRICNFTDNRHKEFEQKLTEATFAKSFTEEPVVFEACVVQITEAFIKISIPLVKFIKRNNTALRYGHLMVNNTDQQVSDALADEQLIRQDGNICMTSINLGWTMRYYKVPKSEIKAATNPQNLVAIPTKEWKRFVQHLSSRPNLAQNADAKDYFKYYQHQAIESLERSATIKGQNKSDFLTGETRNEPTPIKHKREIHWTMVPGTSVLVQLTGSTDRSRLASPAIQLFTIAGNLDVCVQHMNKPLDMFARDVTKITDKIRTLDHYRKKWEPLVRMDAADSAVTENSSTTIQGVDVVFGQQKKRAKVMQNGKTGSVNYFKLKYRFCYDRYIDVYEGDLLCLRLKGVPCTKAKSGRHWSQLSTKGMASNYTVVVHGIVVDVERPPEKERNSEEGYLKVIFRTLSDESLSFIESTAGQWTVEIIAQSLAHRFMQRALRNIGENEDSYLVRSICLGTIQPTLVPWNKQIIERWLDKKLKFPYELNKEQREQEQKAICYDFSLIQGPPGTGKSFLAAQIAAKFAYMNKDAARCKKVLYVGPSNKSVDVAARYLKDISDLKVVRVYSSTLEQKLYPNPLKPNQPSRDSTDDTKKPDERLKLITLHELIRKMDNPHSKVIKEYDASIKAGKSFKREEMDHYTRTILEAKISELEKADIIICTCSLAYLLCELLEQDHEEDEEIESTFAQCIIDECAMCSEPETILPLVAAKPEQVVLIGDHMQLRPVITCNKAEKFGLGESLFMRYKDYVGMLTNQYRMHEDIMKFPSDEFYNGLLTCDKSVKSRVVDRKDPFRQTFRRQRAVFWHVKGEENTRHFKTKDEGYQSKYNKAQAREVVRLLFRLHSHGIAMKDVMVLSPYTAQCTRIRELLQKRYPQMADVHVGTVVTSQGSESKYVILSTVRSLPPSSIMQNPNIAWLRKNLGFLTDPNQINVALTRAKERLFIIGNSELLRVDPLWKKLVETYERRGAITDNLLD